LHGIVEIARTNISGLLLEFFDLRLNIDQITHGPAPFMTGNITLRGLA
jgi:hypothetical protein